MSGPDRLGELTDRLEAAAARLQEDGLPATDAAELAAECARLASEAAAELDRRVRAAPGS